MRDPSEQCGDGACWPLGCMAVPKPAWAQMMVVCSLETLIVCRVCRQDSLNARRATTSFRKPRMAFPRPQAFAAVPQNGNSRAVIWAPDLFQNVVEQPTHVASPQDQLPVQQPVSGLT